jgi:hypothetical protein
MNDHPPKYEEESHAFFLGRLIWGLVFALTAWGPFVASLFPVFGVYDDAGTLVGLVSLTDLLSVYTWPLLVLVFLVASGLFATSGAFLFAFDFYHLGLGLLIGGFLLESCLVYALTTYGSSSVSELTFPLLWVLSVGGLFLFFHFAK